MLASDVIDIQGGYLGGSGTLDGNLVVGSAAVVNPGNSPGTAHVTGDIEFAGLLTIEITGSAAGQYDVVAAGGAVRFLPGARIQFVLDYKGNIYTPDDGTDIEFLTAAALYGLENIDYSITGLATSRRYQVYADGSDLHVRFYGTDGPSVLPENANINSVLYDGTVPAPSTPALALLGMAMLGWHFRRRPLALKNSTRRGR